VSIEQRGRAGRFYARTGDITKAREQGDKIAAVDAGHPAGLFLLGVGKLTDGQSAEASKLFEQAIDRDPDPQYYEALGRAQENLGTSTGESQRLRDARTAYDQAAALAPKLLAALVGSARMSNALYEYDKVLPPLKKAIELAPADGEVAYLFGVAYDQTDQDDAAMQWLAASVKTAPRADAYHRLGELYYARDNAASAASAMTEATKLAEKDFATTGVEPKWLVDTYYMLGLIEVTRGNKAGARAAWSKWLSRNPTDHVKVASVRDQLATL
jgi:tetratricopeptide (TPR) repeat protein